MSLEIGRAGRFYFMLSQDAMQMYTPPIAAFQSRVAVFSIFSARLNCGLARPTSAREMPETAREHLQKFSENHFTALGTRSARVMASGKIFTRGIFENAC